MELLLLAPRDPCFDSSDRQGAARCWQPGREDIPSSGPVLSAPLQGKSFTLPNLCSSDKKRSI